MIVGLGLSRPLSIATTPATRPLYISRRITLIKAHHASVRHLRLSVFLSHYDNDNVKWSHYEFSVVLMCIPKVKIVKNLSLSSVDIYNVQTKGIQHKSMAKAT